MHGTGVGCPITKGSPVTFGDVYPALIGGGADGISADPVSPRRPGV